MFASDQRALASFNASETAVASGGLVAIMVVATLGAATDVVVITTLVVVAAMIGVTDVVAPAAAVVTGEMPGVVTSADEVVDPSVPQPPATSTKPTAIARDLTNVMNF